MAKTQHYYVRVRPYDPKNGAVTQRCTFRGKRFEWERGWYGPIDEELAGEMRQLKDGRRNYIFEVRTEAQAHDIERDPRSLAKASPVVSDELRPARQKPKRPVLSPGETILPGAESLYEPEEGEIVEVEQPAKAAKAKASKAKARRSTEI
ncbi:MAG: hypothetical protein E6R03_03905 [Hyphomicrobiaceae bacterium]|nr:MAG: hypothetical protein E6R03_03905 [Hyphomicrobiaceae bacterium]